MLGSAKLMAFIATTDARRAKAFYGDVLGLRLVSDEEFALVFDAQGTMLRVQKTDKVTPHPFTALGWEVPDIAASIRALTARHVKFERFPGMGQDDLGIWTTPGGSKVAWFKDPEGHVLSLTQF